MKEFICDVIYDDYITGDVVGSAPAFFEVTGVEYLNSRRFLCIRHTAGYLVKRMSPKMYEKVFADFIRAGEFVDFRSTIGPFINTKLHPTNDGVNVSVSIIEASKCPDDTFLDNEPVFVDIGREQ